MVQALYSRSAESVTTHLEKVRKTGSGKFMQGFYVGYNHKSIADCGDTTIFIEGVSTLAAKALQDWPLYSGQETSTRYIDMTSRRIVDPVNTPDSRRVHARWMEFYTNSQASVAETIRRRYPPCKIDSERVAQRMFRKSLDQISGADLKTVEDATKSAYEGAVKARTFDILRGFLPAGITTQLSWHTNLRQAGDHLTGLRHHPLAEIRMVAAQVGEMLHERYPSSGFAMEGAAAVSGVANKSDEQRTERDKWDREIGHDLAYPLDVQTNWMPAATSFHSTINTAALSRHRRVIERRPRGCMLPPSFAAFGQITMAFSLDFGSFRDIQRHRNGACPMPLLTGLLGFEQWYLDQVGDLGPKATQLVEEQRAEIVKLTEDRFERQHYYGLGFRVPVEVTYALPAAMYVLELRSTKVVHPTLRRQIHSMIHLFQKSELEWVPLHVDLDEDDWDVRRGQQTITER